MHCYWLIPTLSIEYKRNQMVTPNSLKKGLRIQGIWHANNKHTHFVIGSYEEQHLYIDHNTSPDQSFVK